MQAPRTNLAIEELRNPRANAWTELKAHKVSLVSAPVAMQQSKYIVGKWKDGDFGKTNSVGVQVLHNGDILAIRLEWSNPQQNTQRFDNNDFPDGAAVLFPLSERAPIFMGMEGHPVDIWHWRADRPEQAVVNHASGIGTSKVVDEDSVTTGATYDQGHWSVVFCRKLRAPESTTQFAQFSIDKVIKMAFAVWDGGNSERGGLKAFSPAWLEVTLAA